MDPIIFMFCLTLHNIEEALWFNGWQIENMPDKQKIPQKEHFIFAVLGITVLGYLTAGLFALFPDNQLIEYAFAGFIGAMLINAVIPHLLFTILYKKYCPGVFTGCFLIMPFHIIILINLVNENMRISEMIISFVIVGTVLLVCIPFFEKIAEKVFKKSI